MKNKVYLNIILKKKVTLTILRELRINKENLL